MKHVWILGLLAFGCAPRSPEVWDVEPLYPIELAISKMDYAEVERLTREDPEAINRDYRLDPPLFLAMRSCQYDVAELLIKRGANVKGERKRGCPLETAAERNDLRMARLLLENGSGTDRIGFGKLPIHAAANGGHLEMVRLLLDHGANVNSISPTNGETPLQEAVSGLHVGVVRFLLSKGADPNLVSWSGTALDIVRDGGYFRDQLAGDLRIAQIRELLLANGAKMLIDLQPGTERFDQTKFLEEHPQYRPVR